MTRHKPTGSQSWVTYCLTCREYVTVDHTNACAWCGGITKRNVVGHKKGSRIFTPEQIEAMWTLYKAGESVPAIARRIDPNAHRQDTLTRAIYRAFRSAGLRNRGREGSNTSRMTHGATRKDAMGRYRDPEAFRENRRRVKGSKRCAGTRTDGEPCTRWSLEASEYCTNHDPETAKRLEQRWREGREAARLSWPTIAELRPDIDAWMSAYGVGVTMYVAEQFRIPQATQWRLRRSLPLDHRVTPALVAKIRRMLAAPIPERQSRAS